MQRICVMVGVVLAVCGDPGRGAAEGRDAAAKSSEGLAITELRPDLFVITTQPFSVNSLLVRTDAGALILVSSPMAPDDTDRILRWTKQRFGRKPAHAINPHWHLDGTAGNQVLRAHDIEVISSRRTARRLRQRGLRMRRGVLDMFSDRDAAFRARYRAFRPTPANRTVRVDRRAELTLSGEPVWLVYAGPSHSRDSLGVYFPKRGVLFGGCAVRSDKKIGNPDEADYENWPVVMRAFAALKPELVVPGHGVRFDPAMLDETRDLAAAVAKKEAVR